MAFTVWVWLNLTPASSHWPIGFEQLWLAGWGLEEQWVELNQLMNQPRPQWLLWETVKNETQLKERN